MPKAERAGTGIFWRQYGDAPDTVLIHCSLAHQGAWALLVKQTGIRGIAFDMPGHGRSDPWDGITDYQSQAADISASFCSAPMHLVGHSFGATVALRLALDRPDLVRSLVLIEPVFFAAARGTPELRDYEASFAPFVRAMESADHVRAAETFTDVWGTGQPWAELSADQHRYIIDRIHLIPAGSPAMNDDNAGQLEDGRLEALEIPTLLMRADRSAPVTAAINASLAKRLPKSKCVLVKGPGHMGPLTHPHLYRGPIQEFREAATV